MSLSDYLAVLRRRALVFLMVVVLVPAVAVLLSLTRSPEYAASTQVLLNQQNPIDAVTGGGSAYIDAARAAQTQADLARALDVTGKAVETAEVPGLTPTQLFRSSSVTAGVGSDLLTFSVRYGDPRIANRLATEYARAFVDYRASLDARELERARAAMRRKKEALETAGLQGTTGYRELTESLAALEALEPPAPVILQSTAGATKVGPRPLRNGIIAAALGLVLGLVVAFLWDALDTRVRSLEAIRSRLNGLSLLGQLPEPPRRLGKNHRLVMMAAPMSDDAEPYRVLRANLELASSDARPRTIMVTSALAGEGKSTTVANLAIALARAGRRVILIDSDLRNPHLHRLFDLNEQPGLIEVGLGIGELADAMQEVSVTDDQRADGSGPAPGRLEVLPGGRALDDPDEIRPELAITTIVESVGNRADFILLDAGPLLPTGEAMTLSAYVDAILLVVRLNALKMSELDDVRRVLSSSPAVKLGFVVTDADSSAHQQSQHSGSAGRRRAATTPPSLAPSPLPEEHLTKWPPLGAHPGQRRAADGE